MQLLQLLLEMAYLRCCVWIQAPLTAGCCLLAFAGAGCCISSSARAARPAAPAASETSPGRCRNPGARPRIFDKARRRPRRSLSRRRYFLSRRPKNAAAVPPPCHVCSVLPPGSCFLLPSPSHTPEEPTRQARAVKLPPFIAGGPQAAWAEKLRDRCIRMGRSAPSCCTGF